ncbi:hypothetical protein G7Z17_g6875 [Cylindrodendrum hubeiense]|uniref:Uncharacterized protein n=1 Tax=Cylindrodendrum hubeiense TaxID=595255 RepID=A0A9P5LFW1_9HYPO|nr:hypothetical protein G7Z17_g6875 [Cylindrodendrum hubeiense]
MCQGSVGDLRKRTQSTRLHYGSVISIKPRHGGTAPKASAAPLRLHSAVGITWFRTLGDANTVRKWDRSTPKPKTD